MNLSLSCNRMDTLSQLYASQVCTKARVALNDKSLYDIPLPESRPLFSAIDVMIVERTCSGLPSTVRMRREASDGSSMVPFVTL